jgi:serine/threonine protein kinase
MYDCSFGLCFVFFAVTLIKLLPQGGGGYVFVADDPDLHIHVVLKMISLGPKTSETRLTHQKMINSEITIGLIIAKESRYLILYFEVFEWMDFFCIKMEYCRLGDLQHQFDAGRIFTERVYCIFLFVAYVINNF